MRTVPMSTTERIDGVGAGECAGIEIAPADEAVDGREDVRVGERDLQFVEARLGLDDLRLRDVDLRERRVVAGLGVLERSACDSSPLSKLAFVRSRSFCATLRSFSR